MMNFTCTYCEKPINGVALLIDKEHFLHQGCEAAFKREEVVRKWKEAGLLKNQSKPEIIDLLECCKSNKIEE